jgi:hypothetical protein
VTFELTATVQRYPGGQNLQMRFVVTYHAWYMKNDLACGQRSNALLAIVHALQAGQSMGSNTNVELVRRMPCSR